MRHPPLCLSPLSWMQRASVALLLLWLPLKLLLTEPLLLLSKVRTATAVLGASAAAVALLAAAAAEEAAATVAASTPAGAGPPTASAAAVALLAAAAAEEAAATVAASAPAGAGPPTASAFQAKQPSWHLPLCWSAGHLHPYQFFK
jgi:hypothetical protein